MYGHTLFSRTAAGEKVYYLYNGHGDVTALINRNGMIITTYYYDAFGVILEESGEYLNPIRYAGYWYDDESRLYDLRARFYDARLARFMQEDTYRGSPKDPLSLNLYMYCFNNPLVYYDPTGHAPKGRPTTVYLPGGGTTTGYINNGTTTLSDGSRSSEGSIVETANGYYQMKNGFGVKVDGPPKTDTGKTAGNNGNRPSGGNTSSSNQNSTNTGGGATATQNLSVKIINPDGTLGTGYIIDGKTYLSNGNRIPNDTVVYVSGKYYKMTNNGGVELSQNVKIETNSSVKQGVLVICFRCWHRFTRVLQNTFFIPHDIHKAIGRSNR